MTVNKVTLVGNLGRDPETRFMPNGDPVTTITLATTEKWKDRKTGEKKSSTEWHRVVFFRGLAEIVGEYLGKGSEIYMEGRLQSRKYTDKDGVERYTTEIVGQEMKMLRSPKKDPADLPADPPVGVTDKPAPNFSDMDDDIPF